MAYVQKNNPFQKTSCGRRRSFMTVGNASPLKNNGKDKLISSRQNINENVGSGDVTSDFRSTSNFSKNKKGKVKSNSNFSEYSTVENKGNSDVSNFTVETFSTPKRSNTLIKDTETGNIQGTFEKFGTNILGKPVNRRKDIEGPRAERKFNRQKERDELPPIENLEDPSPAQKRKRKRKRKPDVRKTTKGKNRNFRTTKEGAGMTKKGVAAYRRKNPGSKLKTAVTGKVKPGSKAAKRRKSFCARSRGWTGPRGKAARRRWKC